MVKGKSGSAHQRNDVVDGCCIDSKSRRLTCCCNDEVEGGVGSAGEGNDVVDTEVAEGGNEGHGSRQASPENESPSSAERQRPVTQGYNR